MIFIYLFRQYANPWLRDNLAFQLYTNAVFLNQTENIHTTPTQKLGQIFHLVLPKCDGNYFAFASLYMCESGEKGFIAGMG